MSQASIEHITVDEKGIARLIGRRTKVMQIAIDHLAGMSAADIKDAYPDLSLSQIYAALTYYYDHQAELDEQIQKSNEAYERGLAQQQQDTSLQTKIEEIKSRAAKP